MTESRLTKLPVGKTARVTRIEGSGAVRQRLLEMGLVRGASVRFVRVAPLGDPIEIQLRGSHLSLRREDADRILVTQEAPG